VGQQITHPLIPHASRFTPPPSLIEEHPMTKLAFTTLACPDWSVPQVIDAARRYGYDGVELRLVDARTRSPCSQATRG